MSSKLMRGAGILMPISSLPSRYGIGTLGEAAYRFADWLCEAGQKYWQVLPVGPTSFGDSPYQSFSAFAGNPYFIDLDVLIKEGLISCGDVSEIKWNDEENRRMVGPKIPERNRHHHRRRRGKDLHGLRGETPAQED